VIEPTDRLNLVGPPYTSAQLEAIRYIDGNLQLIACAGSGKTQVISERVAEILDRKQGAGIRPSNIVAFTFTDRAAAALKDRISQRIAARLGAVTGLADMYVGTVHGYCLDLLQKHVPKYFKYQVLTEVQTRLIVDRNSVRCGMKGAGLRRYVDSRRYVEAMNILREGRIDWTILDGNPIIRSLEMYRGLLEAKAYLDYTSILEAAVHLVEADTMLRDSLAAQVRYLIVDEYQDINPLQERLIDSLHHLGAQVCVVGDDDQTLYQFRGADVTNILTFASRYAPVHTVRMQENFRSSSGVVELSREIIKLNSQRLPKEMEPAGQQPFARGDIICQQFSNPESEGEWIARQVKAMIGVPFRDDPNGVDRGLTYSDFAVLFRSVRGNAGPTLEALKREDIPTVVVGFNNLFERAEIEAARALFGYVVGEVAEEELTDLWRQARVGFTNQHWLAALNVIRIQRQFSPSQRRASYTLQRTFLAFLEALALREEDIPAEGEIIYYNLGKFSQVISDYEQIHFHSEPREKHKSFYDFLVHQAHDYYPEGAQDNALVRPDAVQILTVHQAKGLEWPVVFVPALLKNRFPAKASGGKSVWHIVPAQAVQNAAAYRGGVEEERRVLYVALTRSQKYLYCSFAPMVDNQLFRQPSQFVGEITKPNLILTRPPAVPWPERVPTRRRQTVVNIALTFSQFKYFKECPYQFKLRFLYGFNAPIEEALGYGKSLHDALAEIHRRSLAGDSISDAEVPGIVARHLNVPFAYPDLRQQLHIAGTRAIGRYVTENRPNLTHLQHVEQDIELDLGDGVVVNGRIDLIRNLQSGETAIVDFKSNDRAQAEDVTRMQLHLYTVGYRALTGQSADLIEVHELEEGRIIVREEIDAQLEEQTLGEIIGAALALRLNRLPRVSHWGSACNACDFSGICRERMGA
jgi:DNA helicase-2/ATP-dependent DNA helicase PcrA